MNKNIEILIRFNNIKEKTYDEALIEEKILKLETDLKKTLSNSEKFLFEQIIVQNQLLRNMQELRLIEYIQKTNSK